MNRASFENQLKQIVQAGYATSFEERESGAASVAAPIYNRAGQVVAALSISVPQVG